MCQGQLLGNCDYRHELVNKPCRYGRNCKKMEKCLFYHTQNQHVQSSHDGSLTNGTNGYDRRMNMHNANGGGLCNGIQQMSGNRLPYQDIAVAELLRRNRMNCNTAGSGDERMTENGMAIPNRNVRLGDSADNNDLNRNHEFFMGNIQDWTRQNQQNNRRNESDSYLRKRKLCRNGLVCKDKDHGCNFSHEILHKQCRNGIQCQNRNSTCLFSHPKN